MIVPKMNLCHGYLRRSHGGKYKHQLVWEEINGPTPPGMHIHHINGDRLDNRIENLSLVSNSEHQRLHAGWKLQDGIWFRPCSLCGKLKSYDEYYHDLQKSRRVEHWSTKCRLCRKSIRKQESKLSKIRARVAAERYQKENQK